MRGGHPDRVRHAPVWLSKSRFSRLGAMLPARFELSRDRSNGKPAGVLEVFARVRRSRRGRGYKSGPLVTF